MVNAAMKRVWGAKQITPDVSLISAEGAAMLERVEQGFGKKLIDVGYRSTDFEVLANLQANSYVHAAFKNHSFQTQLRDLLVDGKGGIRSFGDFKRAAGPMVANYYGPWLQAEYQTAVTTGKMAAKWQTFESRKHLFPFLTYLTVGDQRVRDSHRALDRITKHIDDPFWDIHFPPNGWRCRCDVSSGKGPEVDGGIRTSEEQHPPQFRHNAGKEGRFWKEGQEPYRPKCLDKLSGGCNAGAYLKAGAQAQLDTLDRKDWHTSRSQLHPNVQPFASEEEWAFESGGSLAIHEKHELQPKKLMDSDEINIGLRLARDKGEQVRLVNEKGANGPISDSTRDAVVWELKNSKAGSASSISNHVKRSIRSKKERTLLQVPHLDKLAETEKYLQWWINDNPEFDGTGPFHLQFMLPDSSLIDRWLSFVDGRVVLNHERPR